MKTLIQKVKDTKSMVDSLGVVSYNNLPKVVTDEIRKDPVLKNIRIQDALEQVDNYENDREAFLSAIDKNFKFENLYKFTKLIIKVDDTDKVISTIESVRSVLGGKQVSFEEEDDYINDYRKEIDNELSYSNIICLLLAVISVLVSYTIMKKFMNDDVKQIKELKKSENNDNKVIAIYTSYNFIISLVASALAMVLGIGVLGDYLLQRKNLLLKIPDCKIIVFPMVYYFVTALVVLITIASFVVSRKVVKETVVKSTKKKSEK